MADIKKEYAEALFSLAEERDCLNEIGADLERLKKLFSSHVDYLELLCSHALPLSQRLGYLEEAFGARVHEYTLSFLQLLCENGYARLFPSCAEEFSLLVKARSRITRAEVISAKPLTREQKERLIRRLEENCGKTVEAVYECDPSVLGGLKVVMDQTVLDATVKTQLEKVKGVISQ